MPLNPRQRRFVEAYLISPNATQAAIQAGYSARTAEQIGYQLLQKTSVKAAVEAAQAERAAQTKITAEYVLGSLREVAERCLQRSPVLDAHGQQVVDKEGRHVWRFDARGAVGALSWLGKNLSLWTDKLDVTSNTSTILEIHEEIIRMSDTELDERLAQTQSRLNESLAAEAAAKAQTEANGHAATAPTT